MSDGLAVASRALIERSRYLTLATADGDGRPWASPVWYAHDAFSAFLWVSRPDARHSLNIEVRPDVSLVVFDSGIAPDEAHAVYLEADAAQVGAEALDDALAVYSRKSVATGLGIWRAVDVTGAAAHRLYRARVRASFALAANDRRVPVSLP
jgi:uncharacterized protein YhbP (UPF0306 family)